MLIEKTSGSAEELETDNKECGKRRKGKKCHNKKKKGGKNTNEKII